MEAGAGGTGDGGAAAGTAGTAGWPAFEVPGMVTLGTAPGRVYSLLVHGEHLYFSEENFVVYRMPLAGGAYERLFATAGTADRPNMVVFGDELVALAGSGLHRYHLQTGQEQDIVYPYRAGIDHLGKPVVVGERLYVVRGTCHDLFVYDKAFTELLHVQPHTETLKGGTSPQLVVQGNYAWCSSGGQLKLFRIDLTTGEVVTWVDFATQNVPGVAVVADVVALPDALFVAAAPSIAIMRWFEVPSQGVLQQTGPDVSPATGDASAWDAAEQAEYSLTGIVRAQLKGKTAQRLLFMPIPSGSPNIGAGVLQGDQVYLAWEDWRGDGSGLHGVYLARIPRDKLQWQELFGERPTWPTM